VLRSPRGWSLVVKLEFHDADTDTDILARILADTSDTRVDFLKLFLWQAERHADSLATIIARMSARMSVSVSVSVLASWNVSFNLFKQAPCYHGLLEITRGLTACTGISSGPNARKRVWENVIFQLASDSRLWLTQFPAHARLYCRIWQCRRSLDVGRPQSPNFDSSI